MQFSVPRLSPPRLPLRVRVRWRARRLTRELATGADPRSSAELAMRAAALTDRHERRTIAYGIENLVAEATMPANPLSSRAGFDRAAVRDSRARLEALARALRGDDSPRPEGVARAELLLTSYDSPLYVPGEPGAVERAARQAESALRSEGATFRIR